MKPIKGFEGLYSITRDGKVWSHPRVKILRNWINSGKDLSGMTKGRWMKPQLINGYYLVALSKNGKPKQIGIHRLVGISFIKNPENKKVINHKNNIRTDNRIENLEWVTAKENVTKAIETGVFYFHPPKFNKKQIREMVKLQKSGEKLRDIAKINGCSFTLVQKIIKKKINEGVIPAYENKKISKNEEKELVRLRKSGKTLKQLAAIYKCSFQAIHYSLKRINHNAKSNRLR